MRIEIVTGVRFAQYRSQDPTIPAAKAMLITIDGEEFAPDEVFTAANRIGDLDEDIARLEPWQRKIREALDRLEMASMSVDDHFTLWSDRDTHVATYRCDSFGWTRFNSQEEAA